MPPAPIPLVLCRNASVSLGDTAVETLLMAIVINPEVFAGRTLRISGILTGSGVPTINVRSGGSASDAAGTLLYAGSSIPGPWSVPLVIDVGTIAISGLTRLKLTYTNPGGTATWNPLTLELYGEATPEPGDSYKCRVIKSLMPPMYKRDPAEPLMKLLCIIGDSDNDIGGVRQ